MSDERPATFGFAYFVSYAHSRGFGSSEFWREAPIESYDDLVALKQDIEADNEVEGVIILNWIRYPGRQFAPSASTSDDPGESVADYIVRTTADPAAR